jgi:release factor glutamine methyltransferase
MSIAEILGQASIQLKAHHKEERAAFELLKHLLQIESHEMYQQLSEPVSEDIQQQFNEALALYIDDVPLQHLLGHELFFGRPFNVSPAVLIPRYETEELVEQTLYRLDALFADYKTIKVADIGTGSGAIAITLALEEPKTQVYATDISSEALKVAQANRNQHKARVTFYEGDLTAPLEKEKVKVDLLIANPPYLKDDEVLENSVINHEPKVALFGGVEGLDYYRRIFANAHHIINEQALLAFEIGYDQKAQLSAEVKKYFPNDKFEVIKDINGKDRMLFIYHNIAAYQS